MTLADIYAAKQPWKDRIDLIREGRLDPDNNVKEYAGDRKVRTSQVGNRQDKIKDDGGTVLVNKIGIPFNKDIVRTAAAFMFGEPMTITASGEEDLQPLIDEWADLRMDPKILQLCEKAKAFQQCAMLFKFEGAGQDRRQTTTILTPENGKLTPIWASFDTMDAFMWETIVKEDTKEVTYYYIYDASNVQILKTDGQDIVEVNGSAGEKHGYDRIPIVYVEEEDVEWEDVKPLIDRFENRYSRFADTNDYFGSPYFKAKGKLGEKKPDKDDTGTVYELDIWETDSGKIIESDLDVVSWDSAPEATKMELDITKAMIYDLSHTPDLAFNNVKGLGALSGVAIKLMFMSAFIKKGFSKIVWEVAAKRLINLTVAGMSALGREGAAALEESTFSVEFGTILPDNIQETIGTLAEGTMGAPVMSQKTALEHNPLVKDVDYEMEQITKEKDPLGGTENP